MRDDTLEVLLEQSGFQSGFLLIAIAAYLAWGLPAALVVLGVDALLLGLAVAAN